MENLVNVLKRFGYTESETKAYATLVKHGPQSGYEVSKLSGVPRSKIYNILESLISKGVVATTENGERNLLYKAEPMERIIGLIQTSVSEDIEELRRESDRFAEPIDNERIWKLVGYQSMIQKCSEVISQAKNELLVQIWMPELNDQIESLLLSKEDSLDFLAIVYDASGKYDVKLKKYYEHGFLDVKLRETGYRWITIVADGEQMLHAAIRCKESTEVIHTRNSSMVFFAAEYVKHDAYTLKLMKVFSEQLTEHFGSDMQGIRDVFKFL